jgi:hypothetical protein
MFPIIVTFVTIFLSLEWIAGYMSIRLEVMKKAIRNSLYFTCFTESESMRMHELTWAVLPR